MNEKRHIVQIVGLMNRGGAETMLMDIFRHLRGEFHFTFIVHYKGNTITKGDFDDEIRDLGGDIIHIRSVWELGLKNYYRDLKTILDNLSPVHVLHSHLNSKGGTASWVAHYAGIQKILVHSHADIHFTGSFIKRVAYKAELFLQKCFISSYATVNLACSTAALSSLFFKKDILNKKSIIINNAIDCNKFTFQQKQASSSNQKLILGTVGRIAKIKRYELIIDILRELKERNIDFDFIFAGAAQDETYAKAIFNQIKEYNLQENVHWLGCRADVEKIYPGMHIFLGTSISEGLGMSAVECQACGTACLLSKGFPPTADIKAGLVNFIDSDRPSDWVDAILSHSYPANITAEMINERLIKSGFSINHEIEKIRSIYNK
ncbi:MAG: glycosyltransferase [Akkermansia sp.]|nr:glycosyltransferase [Akkermansia sp.]